MYFVCGCFLALTAAAQGVAHYSGTVLGYGDSNVLILQFRDDGSEIVDTLKMDADGRYDVKVSVPRPSVAYFLVEDYKLAKLIFIEDGVEAVINAKVVAQKDNEEEPYILDFTYTGDNKDCYEFEERHGMLTELDKWSWERIDSFPSFSAYRTAYLRYNDALKAECCKIKSFAYRQKKLEEFDEMLTGNLARYAWRSSSIDDADLTTWMESFDRNDTTKMQEADMYLRWYNKRNPLPGDAYYFARLKEVFTNQDIINTFADEIILQWLRSAPEEMDSLLSAYKAVSTNIKGHAKADEVYNHYKKMQKGMPAVDFTFSDAKGKEYSLKDFRGKALYIDVWATWCGPCCMEIPYMAKLTEKYKGDKRINMISISFDSDKGKWLKQLSQDKPGWKQYICPENFKSTLCREYDITGIPRFLFFDKDGNIIDLEAPRPSYEGIEEYIEKNL